MKKRIKKYWKKKSVWGKVSDLVFAVFVLAMLFPQGRMAIGGFANNLKAQLFNPTQLSEEIAISSRDFDWKLKDINGNTANLNEYKGKVLFINLWATWCPPCVGEMPEIQKLYDAFGSEDDIQFLMISNENVGKISRFMKARGYDFPVFASQMQTPTAFASPSIPTTFVISKSGKIVIQEVGAAKWGGEKMQVLVRRLLAE